MNHDRHKKYGYEEVNRNWNCEESFSFSNHMNIGEITNITLSERQWYDLLRNVALADDIDVEVHNCVQMIPLIAFPLLYNSCQLPILNGIASRV